MIAALRFAGQHDMSGVVYRVRTMWERVAVDYGPSDSEWNAAAKAGWAVWAAMVGVEADEGTPEGRMAMFANPFPVETKPVWAARRAAEQGPVSAPHMEAVMVVSLAVEAWEATRGETAPEAANTAWRALAKEEAKKERTWEAVEELVWTVGLLVAFFAAMASAWVLALAVGTGTAMVAASRKWRHEAAARGEAAWATGAAWAPEARVKAAQNTQRVWDYIMDRCLSAIEFEIARAA
jgi:hypothetical protein